MSKEPQPVVTITTNRKAEFNYHILDTVEAGMVLRGFEIKSIRDHKISLDGSYAEVVGGEVWLVKCKIEPYENAKNVTHEPERRRKLLLKKAEISKFAEKAEEKGFTIVPLRVIIRNGKAKVVLAVAKGKKEYDKRETIKERDLQRAQQRGEE
jgi:SsrA-binding protein